MPTYGLSTEGFLGKTIEVIRDEIGVALQQAFGPSILLHDQSVLGQIVGIIAERLGLLWELAEVVYSSQDPDAASGAALEQICMLTGTLRPPATYSAVDLVLTGTATTSVPALSKVKTSAPEHEFQTDTTVVLAAVTAWAGATAYVVGDRRHSSGNVYQCITAGTSHPTTGPSTTGSDITDGTAHWTYLGAGTAAVDVTASATSTGPVTALARDLTNIVNPVVGWDGVINLLDATLGRDIATDAELRLLRSQELATGGSSPIDALKAELLNVLDVVSADVFQNNTDFTDADGIPPHSVEALVRGPVSPTAAFDQSIFDTLLAGVAAGIRTHGSVVGTAIDDSGTAHTMKFTRPTEVPIYVDVVLVKDPALYPVDGDTQVKTAITDWGDAQSTGKNAVSSALVAQIFQIPGVLEVTQCYIGTSPSPVSSATIQISLRQLATYDTSRITVTSSDGVP